MNLHTFLENKKAYLAYNRFRRQIFSELAPEDSDVLMHMLPWMLSLNDPAVPGYVDRMEKPTMVYGTDKDEDIRKRENVFRHRLKIQHSPSVAQAADALPIQGLYTIGSVGTVSQTSISDCDIWICIDKKDYSAEQFEQLVQKTNLIKDWLDMSVRMPVYFFICDIEDIRRANFGSVDRESAGSTQRNTLKEEFYRTMILIAGKIPLWWLCYDRDQAINYAEFLARFRQGDFGHVNDCLDLGALDAVEPEEYFGSALWLFNKALTHPLKSIIKMLLLEMLLAAPKNDLLCHRFRSTILNREKDPRLIDPSTYTLDAVLHYHQTLDSEAFDFVKKCFYLRYDFKLNRKTTVKEILGKDIFHRHPIPRAEIEHLNAFADWPIPEQIRFGEKVFDLLVKIYKRISVMDHGGQSGVHPQDMNIIGRKLSACLEPKPHKVSIFPRPVKAFNISGVVFSIDPQKGWTAATQDMQHLVSSPDLIYCIACLVLNGIYQAGRIKMKPNATSVSINEINGLANRMRDIFGAHDISGMDFDYFIQPEKVTKMLIVVNPESSGQTKDIHDFGVIYKNSWGEVFVRRFRNALSFSEFIQGGGDIFLRTDIFYYIQRSTLYYEKIIERTKTMVAQSFSLVYS